MNNVDLNLPLRSRKYCSNCKPVKEFFYLIISLLVGVSGYVTADESPADTPQSDLEPQVTITQHKDETIEEYRVNNQLYMIKVIPRKGYAYYLVDTDGDGSLDTRKNELAGDVLIPSWTILHWK
jgi:Protein of unknown function (DUF2782)